MRFSTFLRPLKTNFSRSSTDNFHSLFLLPFLLCITEARKHFAVCVWSENHQPLKIGTNRRLKLTENVRHVLKFSPFANVIWRCIRFVFRNITYEMICVEWNFRSLLVPFALHFSRLLHSPWFFASIECQTKRRKKRTEMKAFNVEVFAVRQFISISAAIIHSYVLWMLSKWWRRLHFSTSLTKCDTSTFLRFISVFFFSVLFFERTKWQKCHKRESTHLGCCTNLIFSITWNG